VEWDWLCTHLGAATQNSADGAGNAIKVVGTLTHVTFTPSATVAPSASYDVVVVDEAGLDVLVGLGANLSASATTTVAITLTDSGASTLHSGVRTVAEVLQLQVTNAGDAKRGKVRIYFT